MVDDGDNDMPLEGEKDLTVSPVVRIAYQKCGDRFRRRLAALKKVSVGPHLQLGLSFHFDRDVKHKYYVMLAQNALGADGEKSSVRRRDAVIVRVCEIPDIVTRLREAQELCRQHQSTLKQSTSDIDLPQGSDAIRDGPSRSKMLQTKMSCLSYDDLTIAGAKPHLAKIYAVMMFASFSQQMKETCNGCRANSNSFLDHVTCMFSSVEEQVHASLNELFTAVDNHLANKCLFSWIKEHSLLPVNTKYCFVGKEELVCDDAWMKIFKAHLIDLIVQDSLKTADHTATTIEAASSSAPETTTTTTKPIVSKAKSMKPKTKRKLSKRNSLP